MGAGERCCWHFDRCGNMVVPGSVGTATWTEGWVEHRADGGGHSVVMPQRHDRYCCRECLDLLKLGGIPGQQSLLPS